MWQDLNTRKGQLTELSDWSQETIEFEIPQDHILGAAIKGESGEIYYFTIEEGSPSDKYSIRDAYIFKVNYQGDVITKKAVDTSKESGLNIYSMHTSCMLAYDDGAVSGTPLLAMHLARTMTKGDDGLNH